MKTALLLASILIIPAVLCTESFATNDLKTIRNEIFKGLEIQEYVNCLEQMALPLLAMLIADENLYNTTCGSPEYFAECETRFIKHCRNSGCKIAVMLPWVNSFSTAAHNYMCKSVSFDYINEIWEYGGAACVYVKVKTPLFDAIRKLYIGIWHNPSVNCSSMEGEPIKNMGHIIDTLASCSDKLRDLAINYFNEVISDSPCKGQFHFSAGVKSAVNVGLAVVSMAISYMAMAIN